MLKVVLGVVSAGPVTNMKMPQSMETPAVTKPGHDFTERYS